MKKAGEEEKARLQQLLAKISASIPKEIIERDMEAIAKVPDIQPLELMAQLLEIVKSPVSVCAEPSTFGLRTTNCPLGIVQSPEGITGICTDWPPWPPVKETLTPAPSNVTETIEPEANSGKSAAPFVSLVNSKP